MVAWGKTHFGNLFLEKWTCICWKKTAFPYMWALFQKWLPGPNHSAHMIRNEFLISVQNRGTNAPEMSHLSSLAWLHSPRWLVSACSFTILAVYSRTSVPSIADFCACAVCFRSLELHVFVSLSLSPYEVQEHDSRCIGIACINGFLCAACKRLNSF